MAFANRDDGVGSAQVRDPCFVPSIGPPTEAVAFSTFGQPIAAARARKIADFIDLLSEYMRSHQ